VQKEIVASKGSVELRVRRDDRGRCVVCATGKGKSKAELTEMAEAFANKVTQVYTYNKIMTELHAKGMKIANEEVLPDQSIRINVRNEES
jgi:ABC-type transporter MlaC component